MAGIGDYTPQQMRNLIMKIYPGIYTPSAFNNVVLNVTKQQILDCYTI